MKGETGQCFAHGETPVMLKLSLLKMLKMKLYFRHFNLVLIDIQVRSRCMMTQGYVVYSMEVKVT